MLALRIQMCVSPLRTGPLRCEIQCARVASRQESTNHHQYPHNRREVLAQVRTNDQEHIQRRPRVAISNVDPDGYARRLLSNKRRPQKSSTNVHGNVRPTQRLRCHVLLYAARSSDQCLLTRKHAPRSKGDSKNS